MVGLPRTGTRLERISMPMMRRVVCKVRLACKDGVRDKVKVRLLLLASTSRIPECSGKTTHKLLPIHFRMRLASFRSL